MRQRFANETFDVESESHAHSTQQLNKIVYVMLVNFNV